MASCLHFHKLELPGVGPTSEIAMDDARKCISNFHLSGLLHAGQKSEVHSARYAQAGGVVQKAAVKVLRPEYACIGEELRCFLREIDWARSVRHSLFPRILEAGEHHGNYFLAMERIDGWPLEVLLRHLSATQVALPLQVALTLIHQLADGLQSMHEYCQGEDHLGLVHLGIEPSNIMVRRSGTVLLIDFGETVASARGDVVAASDRAASYQSPERLRMLPLDCRADVFSLGRVLESMLECMDPAEVDDELRALVSRASNVHADERFPTMAPLMSSLEGIAAKRSIDFSCHTCSRFLSDVFGDSEVQTDPRARRPRSAAAPLRMASEGIPTVCDTSQQALPLPLESDTDTDAMAIPAKEPERAELRDAFTPIFSDTIETNEPHKKRFIDEHLAVTAMGAPQMMEGLAASEELTQESAAHIEVSAPVRRPSGRKKFPEELIATKAYSPSPNTDEELAVAIERLRR